MSLYPLGQNHRSKFLIVAASRVISSGVQTEMDFSQLRIHHMFFPFPLAGVIFFFDPFTQKSYVLVRKYGLLFC